MSDATQNEIRCTLAEFLDPINGWAKNPIACDPNTKIVITDTQPIKAAIVKYPEGDSVQHLYGWGTPYSHFAKLPEGLFKVLPPSDVDTHTIHKMYSAEELANQSLSLACLNYARSLHGLTPLTKEQVLA